MKRNGTKLNSCETETKRNEIVKRNFSWNGKLKRYFFLKRNGTKKNQKRNETKRKKITFHKPWSYIKNDWNAIYRRPSIFFLQNFNVSTPISYFSQFSKWLQLNFFLHSNSFSPETSENSPVSAQPKLRYEFRKLLSNPKFRSLKITRKIHDPKFWMLIPNWIREKVDSGFC
jgi:hypothetical protein